MAVVSIETTDTYHLKVVHGGAESGTSITAFDEVRLRREAAEQGSVQATERQHAKGKLTARERIELFVDAGSFEEVGLFVQHRSTDFGMDQKRPPGDGVITGWGAVEGRPIALYAFDFRVFGGSLGSMCAAKIHRLMDLAEASGVPLIALHDGAGARIQEGIDALAGFGGIFRRNVALSGIVPQISVMLGPCAGGAVYSPALTDFLFMVRGTANMYITGPDVIAAVTGENVTHEALGGADVHGTRSGVASFVYDDEETCLAEVRYLLSFLPSNNLELPPREPGSDPADRPTSVAAGLVPATARQPYDMRAVVADIVDDGDVFEFCEGRAGNIICGLARLDGHVVGVVANQPLELAGVLDIAASEKAARFVRTCDAFNIQLLTLVDVPGFLPGSDQEHNGIIRHGAKLLFAYCEATVPRVQVIVRKAYGGAYIVMDSKSIGCDVSYAWPTNEVAVMGADGAVDVIFRKEIAGAGDPVARRSELMQAYTDELMHPFVGAERGLIDDILDPATTRSRLIRSFAFLRSKRETTARRKHGSIPI